jgi:hypothetical protein
VTRINMTSEQIDALITTLDHYDTPSLLGIAYTACRHAMANGFNPELLSDADREALQPLIDNAKQFCAFVDAFNRRVLD